MDDAPTTVIASGPALPGVPQDGVVKARQEHILDLSTVAITYRVDQPGVRRRHVTLWKRHDDDTTSWLLLHHHEGHPARGGVRDLARHDLPRYGALLATCGIDAERWTGGWSAEDLAVGWGENDRLVGCAIARHVDPLVARDRDGRRLREMIVAVDEEHRGLGVGVDLVAAIIRRTRGVGERGMAAIVSEYDTAALRLLRSSGFARLGRNHNGDAIMTHIIS